MHIELVDVLRCPSPHEETWLVAAVTRFEGREIVEGTLGCPVCQRQFPVRAGEVAFDAEGSPVAEGSPDARESVAARAPDEDALWRARALLGLTEAGGVILLGGRHASMAESLGDAVQVSTLLLNPPVAWRSARDGSAPPSAMRVADACPLAPATLRSAWLDHATATPGIVTGVVRALRAGGRLVAPGAVPIPEGVRELARDEREWVGEREAAPSTSAPVPLRRR